jgi:DNA-directed RNA polymerase specialized sigma24 family protein
MSYIAREDAAPYVPSFAVIRGLTYTDSAQIFNRWLIPTYRTAFRWMGTRVDTEDATADVFNSLVISLPLPAEVQLVDEQVNEAALRAVTRYWSDGYDVARVQCSEIHAAEAALRPATTLSALFEGLSVEMRLVLVLRFLRKRSLAAIAAQLGMRQVVARSTMITALTRIAERIGLAPLAPGFAQLERVTAFVDDLIAGAPPQRFVVEPPAWPAMVGAAHVQAAIAGNDLPDRRFVRMIERRLRTAEERGCVTRLRSWSA